MGTPLDIHRAKIQIYVLGLPSFCLIKLKSVTERYREKDRETDIQRRRIRNRNRNRLREREKLSY